MDAIYTYALLKVYYDEGKDYIDAFTPLILSVLPDDGRMIDLNELQERVRAATQMVIPELALGVIATRVKRSGFLYKRDRLLGLTDAGKRNRPSPDKASNTERRINALIEAVRLHVQEKGIALSREEAWTSLQAFIRTNLEFFEQFVGSSEERDAPSELSELDAAVLEYCIWAEQADPTEFETLRDIVLGSVIASSVYTASFADVGRKFERTIVYLDTNVVFNLLELHYEAFNRPIVEMFDLMKQTGSFDFRVFDFTLEEVVGVLGNFSRRSRAYVPGVKVNTIHSSLRSKGWTPAILRQYIASLEEHLHERGIRVEATETSLDTFVPEPGEVGRLEVYKPSQHPRGQNHDLAAILKVKQRRGTLPRQIERAGAIFLTADLRLARFNFVEGGHRAQFTVSEVVPANVLTTFLWLKDPRRATDIPLRSVILMHSHDLLVERDIWHKFFNIVRELRLSSRLTKDDTSVLIFDPHLEEVLRFTRRNEVTPDWVMAGVEKARQRLETTYKQSSIAREAELAARYESELAEQEKALTGQLTQASDEKEQRYFSALEASKKELEKRAKAHAHRWLQIIAVGIVVLMGFLALALWRVVDPVAGVLGLVLTLAIPILASAFDLKKISEDLENQIFNALYRRMIRRSALDEIEEALALTEASHERQVDPQNLPSGQ
ncbi:MAG TPA: hypothetical protein VIG64_12375 [Actinomycetota bacterium]|jgi:hypothetical protein